MVLSATAELLNGFADDGPAGMEAFAEFFLRRDAFARAQGALEDFPFEFGDDFCTAMSHWWKPRERNAGCQ